MKRSAPLLILCFSTLALSACSTVTAPPPQLDGTVVIELKKDAHGAQLSFRDAGTGSVLLEEFPSDPILIDPFTYPFYETVLFLHSEKGGVQYDVRVQRVTESDESHSLHIERRRGEKCAAWEQLGAIEVKGLPAAKLVGFGERESAPELFRCDR